MTAAEGRKIAADGRANAAQGRLASITQEKEQLSTALKSTQRKVAELESIVLELREEVKRGRVDEAAQARVVALEESLSALQEENVRLRMDAKSAEVAAQVLARKLEAELSKVHSVYLSCDIKACSGSAACSQGAQN